MTGINNTKEFSEKVRWKPTTVEVYIAHWSNTSTSIMGVTNHSLIVFKSHSIRYNPYLV